MTDDRAVPLLTERSHIAELFDLQGRVALLTGGSGVLGQAMARGLGLAGATVWLAGRTASKAEEAAHELGRLGVAAHAVAMDATSGSSVEEALAEIARAGMQVDVLVNAAGGNMPQATAVPGERTFFDLDAEALREVVDLNLFGGAILPISVVGRAMVESGRAGSIINITSVSAERPISRVVGYGVAKAGVANLTRWLATHFARDLRSRVRVNAIMPGFFLTEQNRYLLVGADGALTPRGAAILEHTPAGRFGEPDELIGACVFLASDASSFVTGSTLVVDGGFTGFTGI